MVGVARVIFGPILELGLSPFGFLVDLVAQLRITEFRGNPIEPIGALRLDLERCVFGLLESSELRVLADEKSVRSAPFFF